MAPPYPSAPAVAHNPAREATVRHGKRIRLCMKDLYHQDVVEMIERETRKYEIWSIDSPSHPDFKPAYDLLWAAFGPQNEMEPERTVRKWLREDPFSPVETGTYIKYFMIVARGPDGGVRGVRDGCILVNQEYDPDLCVVYLAHIYMLPEARGTVLSYWLRISPVELAMQYLKDLHDEGLIKLPAPDAPGRHFGMRINLTAEMEYFAPEDRLSLQRILNDCRGLAGQGKQHRRRRTPMAAHVGHNLPQRLRDLLIGTRLDRIAENEGRELGVRAADDPQQALRIANYEQLLRAAHCLLQGAQQAGYG